MSIVKLYSEAFLEEENQNKLVARPSSDLWERIMNNHQHFDRIFLRIQHPSLITESFMIALGDPFITSSYMSNSLILPSWVIDTNMIHGCGEETTLEIVTPDQLPKATKITIRPIDSALLDTDVVAQLQPAFSSLGVLQEGKQYDIPLQSMGGFQVPIFVSKLEPSHEVFLDGDNIPVEFEEAVDTVARAPTPIPIPTPALPVPSPQTEFIEQGAVSVPLMQPQGMTQANSFRNRRNMSTNSAFVPFSGEGRRLGGT